MLKKFWHWYERHYAVNVTVSTALFLLQLIHLWWLTTDVVLADLINRQLFGSTPTLLLAIVDYTEIPAIISVSLIYINDLRQRQKIFKSILYLLFLNSQWLHLFWITDEVVLNILAGATPILLPRWLAWMAIAIDYLELPVMAETSQRLVKIVMKK